MVGNACVALTLTVLRARAPVDWKVSGALKGRTGINYAAKLQSFPRLLSSQSLGYTCLIVENLKPHSKRKIYDASGFEYLTSTKFIHELAVVHPQITKNTRTGPNQDHLICSWTNITCQRGTVDCCKAVEHMSTCVNDLSRWVLRRRMTTLRNHEPHSNPQNKQWNHLKKMSEL